MPVDARGAHGSPPLPPLELGQLVEFGLADDQGVLWYPTRLEDGDAGKQHLVVSWPTEEEMHALPLREGQAVILATSCPADALYHAHCAIEGLSDSLPRLVRVRVSHGWERVQRRTAVRWPVAIRPSVAERLTASGWWPLHAVVTNLSAGGIQVRSRDEVVVGDRLDFGFALPTTTTELRVRLDVRHVERHDRESSRYWEAGCQFHEPRAGDSERIVHYIFAQQRAVARRERGL